LDDFMADVDTTTAPSTRYANLRNAVARGQARRLTRGLYASNLGAYRGRTPDVALVAGKAAPDAVLSHHAALQALGVAHSALRLVPFTSDSRMKAFDVDGYTFRRVPTPRALAVGGNQLLATEMVRASDELVRVTSAERTLVDCLMRQDLGGGLEEVLRSVGGFLNVSVNAVADYAESLRSPTAAARAGWVLEQGAEQWHVHPGDLSRLHDLAGDGPHELRPAARTDQTAFAASWRLYVPRGLPYEEWMRS
jgi:predicted transcriptional regulator of viral defense system